VLSECNEAFHPVTLFFLLEYLRPYSVIAIGWPESDSLAYVRANESLAGYPKAITEYGLSCTLEFSRALQRIQKVIKAGWNDVKIFETV